jgi:hypothetical protein
MLLGHLAVPIILDHYFGLEPGALYAASIFPDVNDKLARGLRLTPAGRSAAHSLAGVALSTILVTLGWGRSAGRSWLLGYLGHLLGDMDGTVPWLYPFVGYRYRLRRRHFVGALIKGLTQPTLPELALILWALALVRTASRHVS